MYTVINENSSCTIIVEFRGENGEKISPLNFNYRVDDVIYGVNLVPTTEISNPVNPYNISIPKEANVILKDKNASENRKLTISWEYYVSDDENLKQGTDEFTYQVKNLTFMT